MSQPYKTGMQIINSYEVLPIALKVATLRVVKSHLFTHSGLIGMLIFFFLWTVVTGLQLFLTVFLIFVGYKTQITAVFKVGSGCHN